MTPSALDDLDVPIELEHLCDFSIGFSRHDLVTTPLGTKLTVVVADGRVEGERLHGRFLPGGGDWITLGTDGVARLDVRATLRTDDGALIEVTNTGRAVLDADALRRFADGELVSARTVYARSSPLFLTGDERYSWLNGLHTIAVNQFSLHEVHYRIHAVR